MVISPSLCLISTLQHIGLGLVPGFTDMRLTGTGTSPKQLPLWSFPHILQLPCLFSFFFPPTALTCFYYLFVFLFFFLLHSVTFMILNFCRRPSTASIPTSSRTVSCYYLFPQEDTMNKHMFWSYVICLNWANLLNFSTCWKYWGLSLLDLIVNWITSFTCLTLGNSSQVFWSIYPNTSSHFSALSLE